MRTRTEAHQSFTFENNVVYWTAGPLLDNGPPRVSFDRNLYGPIATADFRAAGMTWEKWRENAMDLNSTIADPMFVNPANGDFTLKAGSPAERMNLKVPPATDVGPRAR